MTKHLGEVRFMNWHVGLWVCLRLYLQIAYIARIRYWTFNSRHLKRETRLALRISASLTMSPYTTLATLTAIALALVELATAARRDLHIFNKVIAPDGFMRECVRHSFTVQTLIRGIDYTITTYHSSVLADGVVPGPLISGQTVRSEQYCNMSR